MTVNTSKAELRRVLRAQRAALSFEQQATAATRLAAHVADTVFFKASQRIACYLPIKGEINPRPIIEQIWALGKLCYLPIVPQEPHAPLSFAPVVCDTSLEKNRFGVLEPVVPTQVLITAKQLDLIFLPLVGFDPEGNRLGMGSGFYDRTLAFLRDRTHRGNPQPIGLAHDFQHINGFAVDPWDVPLKAVITDKYVYAFD